MSLKRAEKNAKRLKKKNQQQAKSRLKSGCRAQNSFDIKQLRFNDQLSYEQYMQKMQQFDKDLRMVEIFICTGLCKRYYDGTADIIKAAPDVLSFMALCELMCRVQEERDGLALCEPGQSQEDHFKIPESLLEQPYSFLDSMSAFCSQFNCSPLQALIGVPLITLLLKLDSDLDLTLNCPVFNTHIDNHSDMRSMTMLSYALDLLIYPCIIYIDPASKPLTVNLLELGRRIIQAYIDAPQNDVDSLLTLCTEESRRFIDEIKTGEHQLSEPELQLQEQLNAITREKLQNGSSDLGAGMLHKGRASIFDQLTK